jgi:hypothetical protein
VGGMYIIPLIGGRVGCGVTQWSLLGPILSAPERMILLQNRLG